MGIFHVLFIMTLEKRVKLQSLKSAVSVDQFYFVIQRVMCTTVGLLAVNSRKFPYLPHGRTGFHPS